MDISLNVIFNFFFQKSRINYLEKIPLPPGKNTFSLKTKFEQKKKLISSTSFTPPIYI